MHLQLLSHPVADNEPIELFRKACESFGSALPASQEIDCYALQAIVCNAFEDFPGRDGVAIRLIASRSPSNTTLGLSFDEIVVSSDGETVCVLNPFTLTSLTYESPHGQKSVHAIVQISLRGTPKQQVGGSINARDQMAIMRQRLASKCTADFNGHVISHPYSGADKVAEMVLEARSELQDHFDVHTVLVHFDMQANEQTHAEPAEQDDTHCEVKRELASPTQDTYVTRVPISSAGSSVCKDVVAIRALLQELDSKLLSITSTSSDDAIASDGIAYPVQLDSKANSRGQMQRGVVVALGSNVGNRVEEIEKACRAIDADPDMRIVDTSFLYETKPMYVEDQERFVNGACEVSGSPGASEGVCQPEANNNVDRDFAHTDRASRPTSSYRARPRARQACRQGPSKHRSRHCHLPR